MAYRQLQNTDKVRIAGGSEHAGKDGVVIENTNTGAKVRFFDSRFGSSQSGTYRELWFNQKHLVILASTPIKDPIPKESYMTPAQKAGYKVGDKFRVISRHDTFRHGAIITLHRDDGSSGPLFRGKREDTEYTAADGMPGAFISLSSLERFVEPVFKVGDRVKLLPEPGTGVTFYSTHRDKIATISHLDLGSSLNVQVEFADGSLDWGRLEHVQLVEEAVIDNGTLKEKLASLEILVGQLKALVG